MDLQPSHTRNPELQVSILGSDRSKPLTAIEAARDEWLKSEGTSLYQTRHKVYADSTLDYDFANSDEEEPLTCSGCREQFDQEWEWAEHLIAGCGVGCGAYNQPYTRHSELRNHRETSQTHKQLLAALRDDGCRLQALELIL
jgi:hypothetical protein